jgi:hypothetical protein
MPRALDSDWNTFEEERERNRQAKEALLNAARATLGFDPSALIDDVFWEPGQPREKTHALG